METRKNSVCLRNILTFTVACIPEPDGDSLDDYDEE